MSEKSESTTSNQLTSSVGDSPVRMFRSQGSRPDSKKGQGQVFGSSMRELLGNYDPVTHLLKTCQGSLALEGLTESSLILPKSGTMRNGRIYQLKRSVRHTGESGCLFLPTPTVMDATLNCKGKAGAKGRHLVQLSHLASSGALVAENPIEKQDELRARGELSAAEKKQMWPTPTSVAWKGSGPVGSKSQKHDVEHKNLKGVVMEQGNTGQLNPTWVEWLQGFPLGWTEV